MKKTMKKTILKVVKIAAFGLCVALCIGWFAFWNLTLRFMEWQASKAELEVTHVAGGVYMIDAVLGARQAGGSVVASVGEDGVLLVDSTTAQVLARRLIGRLEELRGGPAPVKWLINTHGHPDHVLGNAVFGEEAILIAHTATSERLARPAKPFPWLPATPVLPVIARPKATFDETHTLHFNGEEVELLHFAAGHTDGDVVVHFKGSNVVHVGDLFHGRGGRSAASLSDGGDLHGLRRVLGDLVERLPEDVRIVSGHGGVGQVASRRDLVDYHQLLGDMIDLIEERIAAGRTLEEVRAERPTDRFAEWFAVRRSDSIMHGPPEAWTESLYRVLVNH